MMSQFERFGKYILLEKLASGGMAEIYLAKSLGAQGINRFLAVKRILPQFSENPEFKEMFREEAKVSVNLRHSNVVPIFDFGEEKNQFYLVMDYVEGRNVRQVLNELKKQSIQLSIEQICYIVREAAGGLDHAHRCIDGSTGRPLNIIHRDISPQNIMISFEGEVKIIDFGIAKAETQMEATKAGTLKGKFGYMSPEQSEGLPVDVRTDIFSLGIILWELLANDRLFTANSEAAILRKIRECQIPPIRKINPSVPPELEKIVNKVLAKDPNLRYQTATALHKDLNRFLNTYYPEFNPQEFAIFIKNTFVTAFQESKNKLVEYAHVQARDVRESEISTRNTPPADSTIIDDSLLEENEQLKIDTSNSKLVDLHSLKGEQEGRNNTYQPNMANSVAIKKSALPRPPGHERTKTKTKIKNGRRQEAESSPLMVVFIVLAVVLGGGYFAWTSGLIGPTKATKTTASTVVTTTSTLPLNPTPATAPAAKMETASSANYQVTVSSNPPGARIYLNGIDQNFFTPRIMNFEGQRPFHVTLKKDGFYYYEIDFTAVRDAQPLQANLQPLGQHAAYLSFHLIGGGTDPVVEINGHRVGDPAPIEKYPIPARVPVQIRARNAFTGAMAETTVTLQPDEWKKNLELVLGTGH